MTQHVWSMTQHFYNMTQYLWSMTQHLWNMLSHALDIVGDAPDMVVMLREVVDALPDMVDCALRVVVALHVVMGVWIIRPMHAMKAVVALVAVFCSHLAFASMPIPTTLEELAQCADHILVGHVVAVDMIDESGQPIEERDMRTGPGLKNAIRLHVTVDEVLVTNAKEVPKLLKVPLDPFMHYSLGQIKDAHAKSSEPFLVLLQGPSFQPIVPGAFLRNMDEKEKALHIHADKKADRDCKKSRNDPD